MKWRQLGARSEDVAWELSNVCVLVSSMRRGAQERVVRLCCKGIKVMRCRSSWLGRWSLG